MNLTSISKSEILIAEDYCEVHKDESLDLYCRQHDKVYCRKCIHSNHQTCKDVLSLEVASKDIKTSSLLGDTLRDWQNIGSTLESLRKARDENINELDSTNVKSPRCSIWHFCISWNRQSNCYITKKPFAQIVNTTSLKLDKTIRVGRNCYGITTTEDYIAVGKKTEINILKSNGEYIRTIVVADLSGYISFLHYNHNDGSIIYRTLGMINHIQLYGTLVYSYTVPRDGGIAVDKQGHVYASECYKSEIQRVLPDGRFHDVVLRTKTPFAIAFNENFTNFAVTNINGLVQIYNCK
ncbi:unnamed protein product [Mytilus edulis]|uniref:B box-type domain-containing protein n=1 Tax=Mytilus edulis TaxID=6550 RepID=A0A8S3V7F4_MYTED|nr:unnamed protein product [Mytilus edulis]